MCDRPRDHIHVRGQRQHHVRTNCKNELYTERELGGNFQSVNRERYRGQSRKCLEPSIDN